MRHVRALGWLWVLCLMIPTQAVKAEALKLAIANSTCDAMQRAAALFQNTRPVTFSFVCKSSGMLAKGLRGGSLKADLFISASKEWMDLLVAEGLVDPTQVTRPWGNTLVVAVPQRSPLRLSRLEDLMAQPVDRILIGDPSLTPFGRHAKAALEKANLWSALKAKVETRKNVQLLAEALASADQGTVGILLVSNLEPAIRPLFKIDPALASPIRYHVAPLKTRAPPEALAAFLDFLRSP
ncbi:MAG: molybdate ABC transporter substrate-binding protein, partial [Pseudomonadota bacterium]